MFTRSVLTGGRRLSVREETAFAPLDKSLVALGTGAAIALLLAAGAALFVGRRVSRPIAALAGSAQAMARGEPADVGVYKAGFDAHLVKPVSAERLHQVIQELS